MSELLSALPGMTQVSGEGFLLLLPATLSTGLFWKLGVKYSSPPLPRKEGQDRGLFSRGTPLCSVKTC